jgi:hypothetical protein
MIFFAYTQRYAVILTMRSFLDCEPKAVKRMKEGIVIVNRIHPNEYYIGDQLDQLFAKPIPGVRLITRHIPEDAREQRGLVPGSNTAFRQGNRDGDLDEQFVWEVTEAAQYVRAVLDVHGNRSGSYSFYGELARHNRLVTGIASLLCSDGSLVWPTPHLAASLPNYVGWDLIPETDVEALRPILKELGAGWCPPTTTGRKEYCFFGVISPADGTKYGFKEEHKQFEPLPAAAAAEAGLPPGSCAIDWSALLYAHKGRWGEVVIPLPKGAP